MPDLVRVSIDSVKVSLVSHHRVVVLKEVDTDRYLPIWIGPFEADAITTKLQGLEVPRPLTHDLLGSIIHKVGATVSHVVVNDLRDDTFYARIYLEMDGKKLDIDCRPSDAMALAVRVNVPLYVAESVMARAGIHPVSDDEEEEKKPLSAEEEDRLSAFRDFVEELDLDDLEEKED